MSLIRISESDNWIVDYETDSKTYRVSYFEDGHFVDQCRFEPYKKEENADSEYRIIASYIKQGKLPPLNPMSDKGIHTHKHGWT